MQHVRSFQYIGEASHFSVKKHDQKGSISNEFALEIYIDYINHRYEKVLLFAIVSGAALPIICRTDVKSL